jgi:hypothetical protein
MQKIEEEEFSIEEVCEEESVNNSIEEIETQNLSEEQESEGIKLKDVESKIELQVCPKCSKKTFKVENGCYSCINEECCYSKCDI